MPVVSVSSETRTRMTSLVFVRVSYVHAGPVARRCTSQSESPHASVAGRRHRLRRRPPERRGRAAGALLPALPQGAGALHDPPRLPRRRLLRPPAPRAHRLVNWNSPAPGPARPAPTSAASTAVTPRADAIGMPHADFSLSKRVVENTIRS